jgi:hypothetical protein
MLHYPKTTHSPEYRRLKRFKRYKPETNPEGAKGKTLSEVICWRRSHQTWTRALPSGPGKRKPLPKVGKGGG